MVHTNLELALLKKDTGAQNVKGKLVGGGSESSRGKQGRKSEPAALPSLMGSKPYFRLLTDLNKKVEDGTGLTPVELGHLWHDWLWASDPAQMVMEETGGMNSMHLRGVLLARAHAVSELHAKRVSGGDATGIWGFSIVDFLPETDDVHLYDTPLSELTAHSFRDTLEALQLNAKRVLDRDGANAMRGALLALWVRFGMLSLQAFSEDVMDDPPFRTNIPMSNRAQSVYIFTCKALRTCVSIFLVLFRVVEISSRSVALGQVDYDNSTAIMSGAECDSIAKQFVESVAGMIKVFHIEAALDVFNIMQQLFYLAPAQRLVYQHNFSGMYNDISQVTYFNYPEYVRVAQLAPEKMRENGMHSLAPINSIIPKLRIVYDDEDGLPFGAIRPSESFWLVSLGRIYLWDAKLRRLLRSGCEGDGILDLVAYYMIAYHGLDFFSKTCDGNSVDYDDNEHQDKVTGRTARIKLTDFGHARFLGEGVSTLLG